MERPRGSLTLGDRMTLAELSIRQASETAQRVRAMVLAEGCGSAEEHFINVALHLGQAAAHLEKAITSTSAELALKLEESLTTDTETKEERMK